ncbi:hypothetical protein SAMN05421821_109175 [Mucilaginibacter lappiensis]|uniref:Uncharacterized protein n=1 Tax=Mucilaginibacter lappiensis TaxID=354630 RepID=A0A1N7CI31_9SPHI|nr:hypothetical protein [Mucilaginibacter lappiensis]SIR63094.1 hypothetical protein SAMN05421821_109175 [Mucilaginibacter lappiensis]
MVLFGLQFCLHWQTLIEATRCFNFIGNAIEKPQILATEAFKLSI